MSLLQTVQQATLSLFLSLLGSCVLGCNLQWRAFNDSLFFFFKHCFGTAGDQTELMDNEREADCKACPQRNLTGLLRTNRDQSGFSLSLSLSSTLLKYFIDIWRRHWYLEALEPGSNRQKRSTTVLPQASWWNEPLAKCVLRYHYMDGKIFTFLSKTAIFVVSVAASSEFRPNPVMELAYLTTLLR